MHAREHWPDLARVKVRFRAGFRYRYLIVPELLVRTGRRLLLKLDKDYPLLDRFVAAHARVCSLAAAGP